MTVAPIPEGEARSRDGGELDRDLLGLAGRAEPIDHVRVHVRAAVHDRALAEADVALRLLVDRGAAGGMRDVDGDRHVRIDAVGARLGPAKADLLLNG